LDREGKGEAFLCVDYEKGLEVGVSIYCEEISYWMWIFEDMEGLRDMNS
jgi:hypothetical protein